MTQIYTNILSKSFINQRFENLEWTRIDTNGLFHLLNSCLFASIRGSKKQLVLNCFRAKFMKLISLSIVMSINYIDEYSNS